MSRLRLKQLAQDGAATGDAIVWDGTKWAPAAVSGGTSSPGTGAKATLTGSNTAANATDTALSWGVTEHDTGGYHSTSVNPSRMTVSATGRYLVGYGITVNPGFASSSARMLATIRKNGTTSVKGSRAEVDYANLGSAGAFPGLTVCVPIVLTASDYVEAVVNQQSGGTATFDTSLCAFWIERIA